MGFIEGLLAISYRGCPVLQNGHYFHSCRSRACKSFFHQKNSSGRKLRVNNIDWIIVTDVLASSGLVTPFAASSTTPFEEDTKPHTGGTSSRPAVPGSQLSVGREVSMGREMSEASGLSDASTTGRNGWGDLLDESGQDRRQLSIESGILLISTRYVTYPAVKY